MILSTAVTGAFFAFEASAVVFGGAFAVASAFFACAVAVAAT